MNEWGKLKRIKLKGFRSISEMDLELGGLNVLISANGAGKSNFLNFFRFMNKLVNQDLRFYVAQQGGADRILYLGRKTTTALEVTLFWAQNVYISLLSVSFKKNNF